MAFCIPKQLAAKLQQAAKRGEINIKDLYEMTSEQRREFFQGYVDKATAKGINAGFEQAILSKQQTALKTWVKNTLNIKDKVRQKDLLQKIDDLSGKGALDPESTDAFLQDLVAEKLGVTITPQEAKKISEYSKQLKSEFAKTKDEFGNPPVDYFIKRTEMENYLKSLVPSSNIKILTSTIGRASMLLNVKSSLVNVVGNTVQGIEQSLERRISNKQYSGIVDKSLITKYMKSANSIYAKSGYDITRLNSYSDGIKTLGEKIIHSQGTGPVRKLGRAYEDLVFKNMLSRPDVAFSSAAFVDSANLAATKMVKLEGLKGKAAKERANALFKDAAAVQPTTHEGEFIREQAIADALFATFQNDSNYSTLALGIRKLFNAASGDIRLGDQIMPFVKTPANVVGMTLDAGGLGAIRGIYKLPNAIKSMRDGDPLPMRSVARDLTRSGLGITIAFIISSLFDPDDFIGQYPTNPSERELMKTGNATANSIKIGDKWVSLDYFGFLGGPLVGFLYAKKYGENIPSAMYSYAAGVVVQSQQIPGFDAMKDLIDNLESLKPEGGDSVTEIEAKAVNSFTDYVRARIVPGIVYDIAKAFDDAEREVDYKNPLEKVKSTIPGLRETLPERLDIFGEVVKGEPWYTVILFGSRVKTARDNRLINEFRRLDQEGQLPTITRLDYNSNSRAAKLKAQIGKEKFQDANKWFRTEYKTQVDQFMQADVYSDMTDEEKKKEIDSIRNDLVDEMLYKYNYIPEE